MSNPYLHNGTAFYPFVFLRGYAMRDNDIEAAVADPFSGFSGGSTKFRQDFDGAIEPFYFESPVVRLITDYGYQDVYQNGYEPRRAEELKRHSDPGKGLWVYRYYERASADFGDGQRDSILDFAIGLDELIEKIRGLYRELGQDYDQHFRVFLVAHSMGGLIVRSYLQNVLRDREDTPVDKVFTYGTPHNGIELRGVGNAINVGLFDISNFYRPNIRKFLALNDDTPVNSLDGQFDPDRFFCLVGTNHRDYNIPSSRAAVGPLSDGLVRSKNAWVKGAPRGYVFRAHGGSLGMVNSEDGYQNLARFFFGDTRVNGKLVITDIALPKKIAKAVVEGREVNANFYFDAVVSVRGAQGWNLSRRRYDEGSSIRRSLDNLPVGENPPVTLFTSFLDRKEIIGNRRNIAFQIDLRISTDRFQIDRDFWFDGIFDGLDYLRKTITVEVGPPTEEVWRLKWSERSYESGFTFAEASVTENGYLYEIPVEAPGPPKITAVIILEASDRTP
ncbi:MAG: alpha/beta hydrolase [Verrucomicrobiales bacterium]|nr:alpha/beta hydrolase [Verrucomicrobiales bacterium]